MPRIPERTTTAEKLAPGALDPAPLARLFDAPHAVRSVRYGIAPIEAGLDALFEEERALVEKAVPTRQREFASGRRLARRLLGELGLPSGPILRDGDRVPCWPAAAIGSISHSRSLAVVAVARREAVAGIGVDVEPDEEVAPGIERIVCTAEESRWLDRCGGSDELRARRVKLVFGAKEAVYKAFYPRIRVFWGFHDVTLEIDEEAGRIEARLPASADRPRAEGAFVRAHEALVSAFVVPNR